MYTWFIQIRSQGQPINGPIICEKALQVNQMNGDPNFKATTGWFQRFKSGHGIRELDIQGERLSDGIVSAENLKKSFNELCKAGCFDNAKQVKATNNSCITPLVCANSTGDQGSRCLLLGKIMHQLIKFNVLFLPPNVTRRLYDDDPQEPQDRDYPDGIREIIKEAPGFEECDNANISDWLNCDVDDPDYQIFSDEEIVQQIKN
ncbi:jerky protein homolog-like [Diorhabda carinulata]|uniref:jerky protein homolog-like n=1 Tax=Diorhabda carinulata TaxID=1163345 RepID=UPI0025A033AD|nr:jerky protein homolog-like [Diorhabda carinulata]